MASAPAEIRRDCAKTLRECRGARRVRVASIQASFGRRTFCAGCGRIERGMADVGFQGALIVPNVRKSPSGKSSF